jgi:hypothetical protein
LSAAIAGVKASVKTAASRARITGFFTASPKAEKRSEYFLNK